MTLARRWNEEWTMFFIIKEAKKAVLDFSQGAVRVLWMSMYDLATAYYTMYFCFNTILTKNVIFSVLNIKLSISQFSKSKSIIKMVLK